jgi:SH3-like domain-containing protein
MLKSYAILSFFISFSVLQIFPQFATARSEQNNVRYVSDLLVINIKNRLEKPYEVVATVQSDDPVQVIEESGNYLKIETAEGKQGWIGKHYLKSDAPKTLLIKQLKQEISDLKSQVISKSIAPSDTAIVDTISNVPPCQDFQLKLSDAEKLISRLQEELKAQQQQHQLPEPSPRTSELVVDAHPVSTDQLEQTPENYVLLISEYDKRGRMISELQRTLSKKEDQTRFLWFAAGAAVFIIGMLAGRTSTRKKTKLMY